jgi:hypothetical protein
MFSNTTSGEHFVPNIGCQLTTVIHVKIGNEMSIQGEHLLLSEIKASEYRFDADTGTSGHNFRHFKVEGTLILRFVKLTGGKVDSQKICTGTDTSCKGGAILVFGGQAQLKVFGSIFLHRL